MGRVKTVKIWPGVSFLNPVCLVQLINFRTQADYLILLKPCRYLCAASSIPSPSSISPIVYLSLIPLLYFFLLTYVILFIWHCNRTDMERSVAIVTIYSLNHQPPLLTTIAWRRSYHSPPESCDVTAESMFYRHSCLCVVQSCAKRKMLSKEMWSVISLHHRELSTTEAHSHVISHTLSHRTTIINRELRREVKCSLSSYLCCK